MNPTLESRFLLRAQKPLIAADALAFQIMRAKRYGWRDITIRFACDRTTAWRRWQRALQTVADQLNGVVTA